jgi:tetratricopeptide (TPR) repeat protein
MANDSVAVTMARMVERSAKKMYKGSVTLADVVGISDTELEALYGVGYHLFNWGKYQAALDIFSVLTLYSPFKGHYWRAAGAVNQAMKRFKEAVMAYDMALTNNSRDSVSLTYRGESLIALSDVAGGVRDLKKAIECGEGVPAYAVWVKRAQTLLAVREGAAPP